MLFSTVQTPFGFLVTSIFISTTLDGVKSFSRIKNIRNTCKRLYYSQNCWRISLCNDGKLEESEGSNCFFHRFCVLESK